MSTSLPIGVDFGGSGIKAAPVDLERGEFAADRHRIDTPEQSTPPNVAAVLRTLLDDLGDGPDVEPSAVGVTVPGVVRAGVVRTAANIDGSWAGTDAAAVFGEALGRPVHVLNDADAAGLAESAFGAARGHRGLVVVTTLGTGIGSALVHDGRLVPNSELGHLWLPEGDRAHAGSRGPGHHAESWAANSTRKREDLGWEEWADRLTDYYRMLEFLLNPDLIVVGGGVSKHGDHFLPLVRTETPVVPAVLRNDAGIIGAALHAAQEEERRSS